MSSDSRPRSHRGGNRLREQDASRSRPCPAGDDATSGMFGGGDAPRVGSSSTSGCRTSGWWRWWGGSETIFAAPDERGSENSRRYGALSDSQRCTRPRHGLPQEGVTVGADGCHGGGHRDFEAGGRGNKRQRDSKSWRGGQAGFTLGILVALAAASLADGACARPKSPHPAPHHLDHCESTRPASTRRHAHANPQWHTSHTWENTPKPAGRNVLEFAPRG